VGEPQAGLDCRRLIGRAWGIVEAKPPKGQDPEDDTLDDNWVYEGLKLN
jgi:hypothetical protein